MLTLGILAGAWGVFVEPNRLVVRHWSHASPRWPVEYPRLKIALISDLHVGSPHVGLDKLTAVVERTNAEHPDMVLLLGDYVIQGVLGGHYVPPEPIAEALGRLQAPFGVYAVLGNHDWWDDGPRIRKALDKVGVHTLENDAIRRDLGDGSAVWLAGIADATTRSPDITGALKQVTDSAPVLLLSHDPAPFQNIPERPVATFSGHTHGGQIYIPLIGAVLSPGRGPRAWAYGHTVDAGRDLFVTGGIGTSILPVRFNMPPEIVILELSAAPRP